MQAERPHPGKVKKILMVLTSHGQLGDTGQKTGFWLEEFAAPYYAFKDAGADVTLVSPQDGQPPHAASRPPTARRWSRAKTSRASPTPKKQRCS